MYVKKLDRWCSLKAASEIAQLSRFRLLALAADGSLVAERFGGRLCVLREQVEALAAREQQAA